MYDVQEIYGEGMNEPGLTYSVRETVFPSSRWFVFLAVWSLPLIQVNVPRSLPFSGVGRVKQAASGGTGCAVLNGETLSQAVCWEAVGGLGEEGLVSAGFRLWFSVRGARLWEDLVSLVQLIEGEGDILDRRITAMIYRSTNSQHRAE